MGEVAVIVCAGAVIVTVSAGAVAVKTCEGAVTVTGSPGIVSDTVTVTGKGAEPDSSSVVVGTVSVLAGTVAVTPARVVVRIVWAAEPFPPPHPVTRTPASTPVAPMTNSFATTVQRGVRLSPIRSCLM
jgi:hypothetical protein